MKKFFAAVLIFAVAPIYASEKKTSNDVPSSSTQHQFRKFEMRKVHKQPANPTVPKQYLPKTEKKK